ncbi:MAG: hypothetical protein IIA40_13020, partial [SAR324 cluster bacterium]|nr:hypothetical protein [SAR324 cluster bacterium]
KLKPLVFFLEDWHWTDEASNAALIYLLGLIAPYPLLLVVNYRPEYEENWGRHGHHTPISLAPLDAANGERIVRAVLEVGGLPEGFSHLIHERTGGNPFFIEEICSNLREEGAVRMRDGKASLAVSPEELSLPDTVQAVIRSRLDRLEQDHREILRVASVIGREFSLRLLEHAHPTGGRLLPGLEVLKGQDLIQQVGVLPEVEYVFKHVLTQVVVYETMLLQKRKELHGLVGQAIEALYANRMEEHYETLAHHYELCEIWERAVEYYRAAGVRAASLSAHREAAALLRNALTALQKLPADPSHESQGIDIRIALRHSLFPLQRFDEIGEVLEEARPIAEKLNDRSRLGAILTYLSFYYLGISRHGDAIRLGIQALWIANELNDGSARRNVLFQLIQANVSLGDYIQAVALDKRLLAEAEADAGSGLAQLTFVSLARTWLVWCLAELGEFPEAYEQSQRTLVAAQNGGQPLPILLAHLAQGLACLRQGRYKEAAATLEEPHSLSLRPAMEAWWAAVASPLGRAYAALGRLDSAIELLEEAVSRTTSTRGTGHALRVVHLSETYLMAGRIGDAKSFADKAMKLALTHGERGHEAYALLLSGRIYAEGGKRSYRQAIDQIEAAARLAEKLSMKPLHARSLYALATVLAQAGDEDAARNASAMARQLAGQLGLADIPAEN